MSTRKNATKSSRKASINIPLADSRPNKNARKDIDKTIKNMGVKSIAIVLVWLLVGLAIGAGVFYFVSKDDCFELVGSDELVITLDDKYVEQGVKIIEFGKDLSDQVVIETNMELIDNKSTEIGTFYIKYSIDSIKFGKIFKIEKIRIITFVEASEGGE